MFFKWKWLYSFRRWLLWIQQRYL